VNGGSTVEAIDAVEGPTRRIPVVKATIGSTVETEARIAVHMRPSAERATPPLTSAASPNASAAPVTTLAAKETAGVRAVTRSEVRMKPE